MNELLDLESLIRSNRGRDTSKLDVFRDILKQCHQVIERYNREEHIRECFFSVPSFVFGKPPYDMQVLVNFLLHHLRDNGLFAEYLEEKQKIYISWRSEDIDENKYFNRKNQIDDRRRYNNATENIIDPERHHNVLKLQRAREREFRADLQRKRRPPPPSVSLKDYLRS